MSQFKSLSDLELINLLNQGDRKAFEVIYRTHVSDLYKYARGFIASREDCEEIIQDIFEKLWSNHATLRVEALRPYLLKSVKNRILNYFQHSSVKAKYEEHCWYFSAIYDSVEESERNAEAIQEILEQGIQKLPERLQEVIILRLNENLSNKEIAERLNITIQSVKTYIHNINVRMRQSYKDYYNASS